MVYKVLKAINVKELTAEKLSLFILPLHSLIVVYALNGD